MLRFWSLTELTLEAVGGRLGKGLGFANAEFDCENVYEWFEVTTPDGLQLNVSRKHEGGYPDFDEPLVIIASGYGSVSDFGCRLAAFLRATVYYGDVTHLGGDEFQYSELIRFDPPA
jgi:hypothetical protein